MAMNRVDLFSTKFHCAKIKLHMMIWTENDNVFGNIRTVVRAPQWLYVMGLGVCLAIDQQYRASAKLAFIFVK